jgi:hypothetical protein
VRGSREKRSSQNAKPAVRWFLGIDFGTTTTTAAIIDSESRIARLVPFGITDRIPSAVFVGDAELQVGLGVVEAGRSKPGRLIADPKRMLGESSTIRAGRVLEVTDLVAPVLNLAFAEARRQYGGTLPEAVALTHPVRWSQPRIDRLVEAAARAGIRNPRLIAEPVATATALAARDDVASSVAVGEKVAIIDWGGAALGIVLAERTDDSFRLLGQPSSDERLSGQDIDDALVEFVTDRLPRVDQTQLSDQSAGELSPEWERAWYDLRVNVHDAKEQLATRVRLTIPMPHPPLSIESLSLSDKDLREVVDESVNKAIAALEKTLTRNELTISDLSAVFLDGGSSRIALLQRRLTPKVTDGRVAVWGDPKSLTALGAAEQLLAEAFAHQSENPARLEAGQAETSPESTPAETTPIAATVIVPKSEPILAAPRPGVAPAGWYDDQRAPGLKRWWDGTQWTSDVAQTTLAGTPTAVWSPAAPTRKKSHKARNALITTMCIVLVLVIGGIVAGNLLSNGQAPQAQQVVHHTSAPRPSPQPSPSTTRADLTLSAATQTLSGSGDQVATIALGGQGAIVGFSCPDCTGPIDISANGSDGFKRSTTDSYIGDHLVNAPGFGNAGTTEVTVVTGGDWVLTLSPPTFATPFTSGVMGHSDDVFALTNTSSQALITNIDSGTGTFRVIDYENNKADVPVSTTGSYSGTVPLVAPSFVQIISSGSWSVTPQ